MADLQHHLPTQDNDQASDRTLREINELQADDCIFVPPKIDTIDKFYGDLRPAGEPQGAVHRLTRSDGRHAWVPCLDTTAPREARLVMRRLMVASDGNPKPTS